jgi:hypothetical protein
MITRYSLGLDTFYDLFLQPHLAKSQNISLILCVCQFRLIHSLLYGILFKFAIPKGYKFLLHTQILIILF